MEKSLYKLAAAVGVANIAYISYKILAGLRYHFHSSKLSRYHHPNRSGDGSSTPWALVTGASDGIGLAFVHELASRNFNVILHGRNPEKLEKLKAELEQKYQLSFKILIKDATTPITPEFDADVLSCIQGLNLTVVIHNVAGFGARNPEMKLFEQLSAKECDDFIYGLSAFTTHLTRLVLPVLIKNQPGLMLFAGSAVTSITAPYVTMYTATKAYIDAFVRCLKLELKMEGHDIETTTLIFATVATASSGRTQADVSFTMPTTKNAARASLDKVGYGDARITPWVGHWVQLGIFQMLPGWLVEKLMVNMSREIKEKMDKAR